MRKVGSYTLRTIETGQFALDGGAMFGTVPKVLWDKQIPSDESNRIPMALRTLLIQGNGRNMLIDTGMGHKWDEKQQGMYNLSFEKYTLDKSLRSIGLAESDITDVILTHLHFDHAGGATKKEGTELIPNFPNATYYVQKKNYDWAINPNERERASYLSQNFEPLKQHGRLEFIEGDEEFLPGIKAWTTDGHTIGMQCVQIVDSSQSVVYCADLIPTSAHLPTPWIMGYDIQPLVILEEKKRFLRQALDENWILFFEHDPEVESCSIQEGKRYVERKENISFLSY